MSKLRLYISTVLHLKPSQIAFRIWRRLGGRTPLSIGYVPSPALSRADITNIPALPELDFDPVFLSRFDAATILANRIDLLHHAEAVDWKTSWNEPLSTPLWRFNLHYCEYLLPLAKAYLDTGNACYLEKGKAIIASWIESCPKTKGGVAWEPYVISMRVVNWLAFFGELHDDLYSDHGFIESLNRALAEQFVHLSQHLEKDLRANHYLENLKALVMLACYFGDDRALGLALPKLYEQVQEQILPDGMHFELSPMYHKIVLEDLLRVAACLLAHGEDADETSRSLRLQSMCDCLWSVERDVNRTPLFNDSGDNVSKGRDALLRCAHNLFGIEPVYREVLPDAGYAMLERQTNCGVVKVIFDAGRPGPRYAMGHAHCDALSFECFVNGEPWIVNRGTYAYQDRSRLDFKSTLSHNTVRIDGTEQHECWAPFRVARFSNARLFDCDGHCAKGEIVLRDSGAAVRRSISLEEEGLTLRDESEPSLHVEEAFIFSFGVPDIDGERDLVNYSPDFGLVSSAAHRVVVTGHNGLSVVRIPFPSSVSKE